MTSAALHAELEVNGFAIRPGLLDAEEVETLRGCLDRLHEDRIPTTAQVLYTHVPPTEPRPSYARLMVQWLNPHKRMHAGSTTEVISRVAHRLARLQLDFVPFQDAFLEKTADHAPFPWHQDEPFWPFDAPTGLVAWCALDPVDRANGGLELARGSHRCGRGPAIDLHTGAPQVGATGEVPNLAAFEHVCPAMAPGDAVLFRPRTWHRSERNTNGARRRGWSSSWLPPGTCLRPELAPRHPLAREPRGGAAP
ncbi:MAG TPA: phytanoyl-CoA dioxygenase family protein [Kofleriaceae bacterium]|jgi:ectoine hydroxylase-related dioxygenase (phytanoyl-CoA dioxygenase family)|nr:phytanoyl-CoA dioxygenase family protein [Kofleriaceae bacterium]